MLCKITDLLVKIPDSESLALRVGKYLTKEEEPADIIIREELFKFHIWDGCPAETIVYMESGFQFYTQLLKFNGMMLHASAVELDGKAYLFSGPSGMGKSTHTRLWQTVFGSDRARVFNDDKPALRRLEEGWFAYGTPWCGKDGININMKVPLAGICFLKRGEENVIKRLTPLEATSRVISQTLRRFNKPENLDRMIELVDRLVSEIPIYELYNKPEPEAAMLSYNTMSRSSEEK